VILISSDLTDLTTNEVIDWLSNKNRDSIRINYKDNYFFRYACRSITLFHKGRDVNLDFITSYWFRRGYVLYKIERENPKICSERVVQHQQKVLDEYLNFQFEQKKSVLKTLGVKINFETLAEEIPLPCVYS